MRPSELVREVVEKWLTAKPAGVVEVRASAGQNMRIVSPLTESRSENFNLVVQVEASPERVEVVEALAGQPGDPLGPLFRVVLLCGARRGEAVGLRLDAETIRILKEHRKAQLGTRLEAQGRRQDSDLIFCMDDGAPFKPDYVTRQFKRLSALAGLPAIKLHEGRHSAASLARDAEVDPEIRRRTLGHADAAMTSHYTHSEAAAYKAAAEAVARLVEGAS